MQKVRPPLRGKSSSWTFQISFLFLLSLARRYVTPKYAEYFEGTGFSKVIIDKKLTTLLIRMSLHSRSENGLLLYVATKVKLFVFKGCKKQTSLTDMSENVMHVYCRHQDDYFTVTMEKGIIYLRGNLIAAPASKNIKKFPVTFPHLSSFHFTSDLACVGLS